VPRVHGHKRLDDDAIGWLRHQRSTSQNTPTQFWRKFIRCCLYYYRQCRICKRRIFKPQNY